MKQFFLRLLTLSLFILAVGLFYLAVTFPFSNLLVNVILLVVALFVTVQACGNVDKLLCYGKYKNRNDNNNKNTEKS
jgi:fatty acid desaturase